MPFQGTAELPDLEGKGNRKDRPGNQEQLWVVHACQTGMKGASRLRNEIQAIMNITESPTSLFVFETRTR